MFAVQVTEEGNEQFKKMVKSGDFAGFIDLPEGSIIHHTINVQS